MASVYEKLELLCFRGVLTGESLWIIQELNKKQNVYKEV